jgi:hypothetical protein
MGNIAHLAQTRFEFQPISKRANILRPILDDASADSLTNKDGSDDQQDEGN